MFTQYLTSNINNPNDTVVFLGFVDLKKRVKVPQTQTTVPTLSASTHHYDLLVVSEDGVAVDHADDGHAQVTSDTEGDAEANAREDGNDVTSGQAKACAVHDGQLLLLHQLRPALRRQLDGLAIFLLLLKSSAKRRANRRYVEQL